MVEQCVDHRAVRVACRRVNDHPCRLIDDREPLIEVDHLKGEVLSHRDHRPDRLRYEMDPIISPYLYAGFGGDFTVYSHSPVINRPTYLASAQLLELTYQPSVKATPRLSRIDRQLNAGGVLVHVAALKGDVAHIRGAIHLSCDSIGHALHIMELLPADSNHRDASADLSHEPLVLLVEQL